ncbi:DNA/RNA non-specific endonuclease [Alcaligenaceae bacterium 429]|uniref:DNA/RNA non-specific endonuclease n=1 Tax=Paenalcaligenes sp. Me52 TaxID=3392038 RepID=UPI001092B5ED|nr:DNA/RNA non-specific endonuclease [Alcaligenaceae bacterium 429]
MAERKKPVASRAASKRRASQGASQGGLSKFWRTVSLTAIAVFSISSVLWHADGRYLKDELVQKWAELQTMLQPVEVADYTPETPNVSQHVQTSFSQCTQMFPGPRPIVPNGEKLRELCFSAFAILHNGQTKTPVFVVQRLSRQMINRAKGQARTDRFYEEARLPRVERAKLDDYRRSGYSRGHMAPAGDMHDSDAMAQSFSLANMVPQDQRHNAGAWSRIESDTRKYVSRAQGDVYVFTGPYYANQQNVVGEGRVVVPTHLYKVVYDATTGRSWVHWHENKPETKVGPPISYAEFVQRTGLHLLPQVLPSQ